MIRNIVIIYPPGAGGNHLLNLLSTHSACNPRFESQDYYTDLYTFYCHAVNDTHLSRQERLKYFGDLVEVNFSIELLTQYQQSNRVNLFAGHLGDFLRVQPQLNYLDNRHYIIFGLPEATDPLTERIKLYSQAYNSRLYSEIKALYSADVIQRLTLSSNVHVLNLRDFVTVNSVSFTNFIENLLGPGLPVGFDNIHHLWVNNIYPRLFHDHRPNTENTAA